MKETFILPDQKAAARRSRNAAERKYDLFRIGEDAASLGSGKKYIVKTYGCQANVRDGETLSGMIEAMGYTPAEHTEDADVIVFNTCAIRRAAEEHVLGEIGSLKHLKQDHPDKVIAVCGCMAQEEEVVNEILKKYPQVDLIFGTHNIYRLPELLVNTVRNHEKTVEVFSEEGKIIEDLPVRRTSKYKGFVNIMYGCDKFCTYCIVPYTRGKQRSRSQTDILNEIRELKEQGRREVILLGQNVNAYGKDLGMEDGFADLLAACAETGIDRIRFYTSHPRDYSVSAIDVMQKYPNIMKSLHLPVQSGSDEILRRMARGYTVESYRRLYDEMKKKMPEITFTTDLIVGFPGETEEDFQKTLDLVDYCKFDMAYSFVFSPRSGTPAASMPDDTPEDVKKQRLYRLNERLGMYARTNNENYRGKVLKVLCEGKSKKNKNVWSGYSEENKLVNFTCERDCEGEIVDVKITDIHSYTLDGIAL